MIDDSRGPPVFYFPPRKNPDPDENPRKIDDVVNCVKKAKRRRNIIPAPLHGTTACS
jgi:hypothetical protein